MCSLVNAQIEPECGTTMSPEAQAAFEQLLPQIQRYEAEYFELASSRRSSTAMTSVPIKVTYCETECRVWRFNNS